MCRVAGAALAGAHNSGKLRKKSSFNPGEKVQKYPEKYLFLILNHSPPPTFIITSTSLQMQALQRASRRLLARTTMYCRVQSCLPVQTLVCSRSTTAAPTFTAATTRHHFAPASLLLPLRRNFASTTAATEADSDSDSASGSDSASDSDSDSDSDDDFNFDDENDDNDEEEVVAVSDAKVLTPEELAQITADVNTLVAEELAKIESDPRTRRPFVWREGNLTLTARESRFIRLDKVDKKKEEEPAADADLVEPAEGDAPNNAEAGVDSAHVKRVAPQFFSKEEVMSPTWYDEKRERRIAKLGKLKRRGKGPPKKGSGKRTKKK